MTDHPFRDDASLLLIDFQRSEPNNLGSDLFVLSIQALICIRETLNERNPMSTVLQVNWQSPLNL